MASMRNHKVIEVYKKKDSTERYHVTANNRVLRTLGPRGGGAQVLITNDNGKTFRVGLFDSGYRRATATEWKQNTPYFASLERES